MKINKIYGHLNFIILCFFLLIKIQVLGQYSFDWSKTYGGDAWDECLGMVETHDGHLLLCGYTKSQEKHLWLVKIDESGNTIWGKTYKATPISEGRDIIIAGDSTIVIAGYSVKPFSTHSDFWLIKLNSFGEKLWDKNYGGTGDESANGICKTSDLGYVLAGINKSGTIYNDDAWVIKVDSAGEKLWERTFGGKRNDFASDVIETSDKGIVVCGMTSSRGQGFNSFWIAKMDSSGVDIWDNVYPVNNFDEATAVVEGLDRFIYVVGYTRTYSTIDYDVVLLKIDLDGNLVWQKTINWGKWDQATSICSTFDNGIVVSGFTRSGEVQSSDFAATKFDENGNILWENIFIKKSLEYPNNVTETRDNGLAMAGTTYAHGRGWDFALLKFKNNDLPVINFSQDSVSTSNNEIYTLNSCINTKSNLKNIQVFFNDSLIVDQFKRGNQPKLNCDIPLNVNLQLLKGLNFVEVVLTDFKGHQTRNNRKIYFIPPAEENW